MKEESALPMAAVTIRQFSEEENRLQPLHSHREYELYYLFGGYRTLCVQGREYVLRSGDAMIIPGGLEHSTAALEDLPQRHVVLHVQPEAVSNMALGEDALSDALAEKRERMFRLPTHQQYQLDSYLYELEKELDGHQSGWSVAVRAQLELIGVFFLRNLHNEVHLPEPGHRRRGDMRQIAAFVEEHYTEPITLGALGRIFMINPSVLSRSFKREIGVPPMSYLNRTRIQAARKLIETTDLSVSQICTRVGYDNLTYFGRIFREYTGSSPSAYRRSLKAAPPEDGE